MDITSRTQPFSFWHSTASVLMTAPACHRSCEPYSYRRILTLLYVFHHNHIGKLGDTYKEKPKPKLDKNGTAPQVCICVRMCPTSPTKFTCVRLRLCICARPHHCSHRDAWTPAGRFLFLGFLRGLSLRCLPLQFAPRRARKNKLHRKCPNSQLASAFLALPYIL